MSRLGRTTITITVLLEIHSGELNGLAPIGFIFQE